MLHLITKKSLTVAALALATVFAAHAQSSSSSAPQAVAAPGTVAITPQNAAALAAPYTGPKYNNRWEIYGGLLFMNDQAGQNLPKRYNMGGGEGMFTYWIGADPHTNKVPRWGVFADYRFGAGTTPVISPFYNRVLIMQHIMMGGVAYRGPHNRYVDIHYHVMGGGDYGIFDHAVKNYPGGSPVAACPSQVTATQQGTLGLYCNHVGPYGAAGGSIDFNQSPRWAVRLQPDLIFEHMGTETREYVSVSLGAMYRFGVKKTAK
jgi:hypothetical protein